MLRAFAKAFHPKTHRQKYKKSLQVPSYTLGLGFPSQQMLILKASTGQGAMSAATMDT